MSMLLISATPGGGKTQKMIALALERIGIKDWKDHEDLISQYQSQPRKVVACGIEGLLDGLFEDVETIENWEDYEDGTLFLLDEAWRHWDKANEQVADGITKKIADAKVQDKPYTPPKYWDSIKNLAEHRHRGFDFIYATQYPAQIGMTPKALTDQHLHIARKFNTSVTQVYEWPAVVSNPNSQAQRALALTSDWIHNSKIFSLYKSASIHNMKRRIPWKVYMLPVIAAVGLACVIGAIYVLSLLFNDPVPEAAAAGGAQATQGSGSVAQQVITPEQYLAAYVPRVPSQPWSAPAYDSMKPDKAPRLFCISSQANCTCMTEQGTKWELDSKTCRTVARWGQYEPLHDVEEKRKTIEPRKGSAALHAPPREVDLTPSTNPATYLQRTATSSGPLPNAFSAINPLSIGANSNE